MRKPSSSSRGSAAVWRTTFLVAWWLASFSTFHVEGLNATVLDCGMRRFALDYAHWIQPWNEDADLLRQQLYDALELAELCHLDPPLARPRNETRHGPFMSQKAAATCRTKYCIYVGSADPKEEATSHRNLSHHMNATTVEQALSFSRSLGEPAATTIVLGEGVHELKATLALESIDSGLTLAGPSDQTVWLSGGLGLPADIHWSYDCSVNLQVRVTNLTQLLNGRTLPKLPSLFSRDRRWNRARYPNGDFETTQWGYNSPGRSKTSIAADQVLEWHRPPPGQVPLFTYVDLRTHDPPKNDSNMADYNVYASGRGGVCADLWGPEVDSYWCSNASAGGWAEVDQECAVSGQLQIPVALRYNQSSDLGQMFTAWGNQLVGAIVHAWHSQTWAMHMFPIDKVEDHTLFFGPGGGKQGGRNWCRCDQCTYAGPWCGQHQIPPRNDDRRLISGSWLIENLLAALDEPGEYFFDPAARLLYVYPNRTQTDPSGVQDLRLALLETIISIKDAANITVRGIGFRDTAATYMSDWGVPSGGDWALHRGGGVFVENVTNLLIENCTFRRLDGNAIFLSRRTRNVTIRRNRFEWLGENAIATWGQTSAFNAMEGDYPIRTLVERNVMRELGIYQKQSSAYAHSKAALSIVRKNIMFNMPRAAINFNDMMGGGDLVYHNLIFNTCRESGDHGAINTWDRQPFLTDLRDGRPSFQPRSRKIWRNLIFANYGAGWGLDNDDGSSWYEVWSNVFYASQVSIRTRVAAESRRWGYFDSPLRPVAIGRQNGLRRP